MISLFVIIWELVGNPKKKACYPFWVTRYDRNIEVPNLSRPSKIFPCFQFPQMPIRKSINCIVVYVSWLWLLRVLLSYDYVPCMVVGIAQHHRETGRYSHSLLETGKPEIWGCRARLHSTWWLSYYVTPVYDCDQILMSLFCFFLNCLVSREKCFNTCIAQPWDCTNNGSVLMLWWRPNGRHEEWHGSLPKQWAVEMESHP